MANINQTTSITNKSTTNATQNTNTSSKHTDISRDFGDLLKASLHQSNNKKNSFPTKDKDNETNATRMRQQKTSTNQADDNSNQEKQINKSADENDNKRINANADKTVKSNSSDQDKKIDDNNNTDKSISSDKTSPKNNSSTNSSAETTSDADNSAAAEKINALETSANEAVLAQELDTTGKVLDLNEDENASDASLDDNSEDSTDSTTDPLALNALMNMCITQPIGLNQNTSQDSSQQTTSMGVALLATDKALTASNSNLSDKVLSTDLQQTDQVDNLESNINNTLFQNNIKLESATSQNSSAEKLTDNNLQQILADSNLTLQNSATNSSPISLENFIKESLTKNNLDITKTLENKLNYNDAALLQMNNKILPSQWQTPGQLEKLTQPVPMHDANWSGDLSNKMIFMSQAGINTAHIQLDPPELGKILAHIRMDTNNTAEITLIAASSAARDTLQENLQRLKDSFQEAGYNLLNVNIQSQNNNQQQSEQYQRSTSWSNNQLQPDVEEPVTVIQRKGDGLVDYYA